MNSQTVTDILEECHRCVEEGAVEANVEALQDFTLCRETLSDELVILLQDAVNMKWPFVPEKWQYKHSLTSKDKVNLKDLISENLSQLLAYLKAAILAGQPLWAASAIFLVDRFLYWTDDSRQLLRITRKLHQRYPGTPIAPQVVIRQARVYFSTGKLQKAEYILANLISNSGSTGCWRYHTDTDRTLVQAVSVQVRGQVLQKLGLWFESAELICASLVGFYALPQPDKKGIGTSLGILANILVSMDDKDFHRFRTSEDTHMSFLGKIQHRLLSAAEAAKMAVIYSQYASLYVLTNVVAQGTCLLSYSFSTECPPAEKTTYLTQAKEAFEIGLLTKTEEDVVTSKQELHTFVKAAYALTIIHKWLGSPYSLVVEATQVCREASTTYYSYCFEESAEKGKLCREIMWLVHKVKSLLKVEPFVNTDPGSFIPDTYRAAEDRIVVFTLDDFAKIMKKFQQHHQSVCESSKANCHRHDNAELETSSGICVTSFGTATEMANTECTTESQVDKGPSGIQQEVMNEISSYQSPTRQSAHLPGNQEAVDTATSNEMLVPSVEGQQPAGGKREAMFSSGLLSNSLGSSWGNMISINRNSNQMANAPKGQVDSSCPTESDDDDPSILLDSLVLGSSAASIAKPGGAKEDKGRRDASTIYSPSQFASNVRAERERNKSHRTPLSKQSTTKTIQDQSSIETEEDETDMQNLNIHTPKGTTQSIKQRSSSSSLSSSFGSLSSWQKVPSLDTESSVDNSPLIGQGKGIPTNTGDEKYPGPSMLSHLSRQSGGTLAPGKTIPKTMPDQRSIETEEEDLNIENISHTSLNFKEANQGNKERSCSSSLSSSFGSLSSWQKIPSLATGSSIDEGQEVVGGNDIPTNQVDSDKKCQDSTTGSISSGQRGREGNKRKTIAVSATIPKTISDQNTETGEDEPDRLYLNHTSVGLRGPTQGNKVVSFSSSLSSSFGSTSSWQKVPSLDTGSSFNSDSGLTGRREGVPANTGELFEANKLPCSSPRHYGGPQKSSEDSSEMKGDILDPLPHSFFTQDVTKAKKENSSNRSQQSIGNVRCKKCFPPHFVEMGVLSDILTRQDYSALLAGVCHGCLINRLPKKTIPPLPHNKAYGAVLLKFSKSTGLWTGRETNIYIGGYLQQGQQRKAFQVQFLHQEELLGSYVGKQYYRCDVALHDHLNDVERQMTAQYYVTEFNKKLYEKSATAQIFFIPSEVLLILEGDTIIGCVTAEPYMLGTFSKLTNNTKKVIRKYKAFEYGIAFGHFTYEYSGGKEVVVDLQGWVSVSGKGLTYLTDPQIHTLWKPRSGTSNFHQRGINLFLEEQHGPECNEVCKLLGLRKLQMPKARQISQRQADREIPQPDRHRNRNTTETSTDKLRLTHSAVKAFCHGVETGLNAVPRFCHGVYPSSLLLCEHE
ncbi:alpha-protein kinase 1 [Alosa sapidissima]|uniref:alpha-protein kinase 1 n=1 Tax=Alosa sapidissima TaxID=34773 RepID=UPI001C08D8FF|nr:alpha-protein kinase 1 [Alosa sapidissima]